MACSTFGKDGFPQILRVTSGSALFKQLRQMLSGIVTGCCQQTPIPCVAWATLRQLIKPMMSRCMVQVQIANSSPLAYLGLHEYRRSQHCCEDRSSADRGY